MKLEISEIKDRGVLEERIIFAVKEDCDIGRFFVFSTQKSSEGKFSSLVKHPYWFPDKSVKKGDLVVLYSKKGTSSYKLNSDQTSTHFYYRNFEVGILEGNIVLLVEANTWSIEKD
jgi:hypothetical protein